LNHHKRSIDKEDEISRTSFSVICLSVVVVLYL